MFDVKPYVVRKQDCDHWQLTYFELDTIYPGSIFTSIIAHGSFAFILRILNSAFIMAVVQRNINLERKRSIIIYLNSQYGKVQ